MLLPILQVNSEDIPPYVLVCGDPGRAAVGRELRHPPQMADSGLEASRNAAAGRATSGGAGRRRVVLPSIRNGIAYGTY